MKRFLAVLLSVLFVCGISYAEEAGSGIRVGDYIRFGRYEQDNVFDNGPEEIEWLVVEAEEEYCCLVSKYILDVKPYHDKMEDVNWETCWLRNWLNEEFIQTAFSAEEQKLIPVTHAALKIYGKPDYYTDDKIYLLSYDREN